VRFGAGVNRAEARERLMDIGPFDCFLLAGRHTLLEQDALDRFLPRRESEGMSVVLGLYCSHLPLHSNVAAPPMTVCLRRFARTSWWRLESSNSARR
jgi:hypothetical protein